MRKILKFAFVKTLPVLFGYLFLGFAFGILLQKAGYHFIWAFLISLFVYAGSMQFVLISFFGGGVDLITIAIMTLLINSRHMFYGLSFIEKFKTLGKAYPYMIFSLTDETYSILCSTKIPDELDEKKVLPIIAMFDHSYWIIGSVLGALAGQMLPFDATGIDFAMTALFVVIFVEQWLSYPTHIPALVGLVSGILSLLVFGPEKFILPSLIVTVSVLLISKSKISAKEKGKVVA